MLNAKLNPTSKIQHPKYNILVTGANGQLGSELRHLVDHSKLKIENSKFHFATRNDLDLSNLCKLEDFFEGKKFDAIINCAAYTAVDKAESEPDIVDIINHKAVSILEKIAKRDGSKLIHISTDYVFNGKQYEPYVENHPTDPLNVYGISKRNGENAVLSVCPENSVIIRSAWFFSSYGNNFLQTILRIGKRERDLKVVFDQIGTPTYARDLARTILAILPQIQNTTPEIYHYSNEGVASWYDFSKEILDLSGVHCEITPITTKQYPTPALRPYYTLLNKSKIKEEYSLTIPYWKDSLKECLKLLGEKQ